MDYAFLQHGEGTKGPFRTERAPLRHLYLDQYQVRFEGAWRKVHVQVKRLYITFRGSRITVLIEGL